MLVLSCILLLVILLLAILAKWYHLKYKYYDTGLYAKYTGMKLYPIIGNAWDVVYFKPYEFLDYITKLCFDHKGTLLLQLGFYYSIFVSDYKLIEFIMTSNSIATKAEPYHWFSNWLGTGLLLSNGEKWKRRRKMITPAFHYQILESFSDVFHSASDTLVQVLGMEIDRANKSMDIHPAISLCTLDVICEAAMGTKVNAQTYKDSEYVKTVKDISRLLMNRLLAPSKHIDFLYRFSRSYRMEMKYVDYLHSHTTSIIKMRRKELEKLKNKNLVGEELDTGIRNKCAFLDILLRSTIDDKPLSDEDIREEVDTFMFEGHDTTASAISFALFSIAQYSEVQEKILEEQKFIFGEHRNRAATYNELNNMKYLEMVIKETLRLYPSVPAIGRAVTEDFEYDGVKFKKGLQIVIMNYSLQRNPEYFADPEKFIPERFAPENQIEAKPFAYIPFSAGARNCIGQRFAMLEMKSILAKILRYFEVSSVRPLHKLQLVPELILKASNGTPIHLEHRKWNCHFKN